MAVGPPRDPRDRDYLQGGGLGYVSIQGPQGIYTSAALLMGGELSYEENHG